MKENDRIEDLLSSAGGLDDEMLEKISESCSVLSEEQKNRIFGIIQEKESGSSTEKTETEDDDVRANVIEFRRSRSSTYRMIAAVAACACLVIGTTVFLNSKKENINVGNNDIKITTSAEETKGTEVSETEIQPEEAEVTKVTVPENESAETVVSVVTTIAEETAAVAETSDVSENEKTSEEKNEEPAEENNDSAIEIRSDGTAVVTEDGIRYGRMSHEAGTKYTAQYSDAEIDRINEDLKYIQHDAFEKYGNWQKSGTEEQQGDGISFITFSNISDYNKYLRDIWVIDTGNPEGKVYYDAKSLGIITVEQFFGAGWDFNNLGTTDDESLGSSYLVGNISFETDGGEDIIVFENRMRNYDIKLRFSDIISNYNSWPVG